MLLVDGSPQPVKVDSNSRDDGLDITGDDWSMDLEGLGPNGRPLNLGPGGVLRLQAGRGAETSGRGFLADSEVALYLNPPGADTVGTSATTMFASDSRPLIFLGVVSVNDQGTFKDSVVIPRDVAPGRHVLQAVGLSPARQTRAMSIGVLVDPSLVLKRGKRSSAGVHDRIRTTGASTGLVSGTRLIPYVRYSTSGEFKKGKATITVQSDGTFRWTRLINKSRTFQAYVGYRDIDSNMRIWVKLR
jgi:hypothetical protein